MNVKSVVEGLDQPATGTQYTSMSIQAQLRVQPWPSGNPALMGCVCGIMCAACSPLLLSVCAGIKEHQRA